MFRYFYRIYDKNDEKIYAVALLTSETGSRHQDYFSYSFYSTKLSYSYQTYKFREHSVKELEQSSNPFAAAVIAAKYANRYKHEPESRFSYKQALMEQMITRFSNKKEKSSLYLYALSYFIDYLLKIPEELQEKLEDNMMEFMEEEGINSMQTENMEVSPTLAAIFRKWEEIGLEKGIEQGIEQGLEKGIKRGLEQGIDQERQSIATKLIGDDFSNEKVMELTNLTLKEIESIRNTLK